MIEIEFQAPFDVARLAQKKQWLESVISSEGLQVGDIQYVFCTDEFLHAINLEYLQHDTYTDIISFDYTESSSLSAEMFISLERVTHNAKAFNQTFDHELCRVMVHGVLHCCGYNDNTPDQKALMRQKEDCYIAQYVSNFV